MVVALGLIACVTTLFLQMMLFRWLFVAVESMFWQNSLVTLSFMCLSAFVCFT
jgi:hypothetical protein